ncbi:hypothetical protein [Luteibacter sp.]|uniref:hypothetical protein n=1 Tax=Luteibacter sp. TaxID=1886636 RepID=UPI003F7EDC91
MKRRTPWSVIRAVMALLAMLTVPVKAGTVIEAMQAQRVAQLGMEASLAQDETWFARQMLVNPASPYSDAVAQPSFTNEAWWQAVLEAVGGDTGEEVVLARLRRELGMERARPGIDVTPGPGFRDPFVAAHATKAGLDVDIFWRVLDVFGYDLAPRFASHAIGLQLLRDAMATVPAERHLAAGIRGDVLSRFMQARVPSDLTRHDLRYVEILVQHRLVHPGRDSQLPTAWRVARAAAAFRDAAGYVTGAPCLPDASPDPRHAGSGVAGDDRVPCLVAATDRAVHRWYIDALRRPPPRAPSHPHGLAAVLGAIGLLLPLLDMAAVFEVVEAAIADDAASLGAIADDDASLWSARAHRLTCRIPE